MKKLRGILLSICILSLTCFGLTTRFNAKAETTSIVADVNAFYSSSGEKLTGTAEWESKSSGSGVAYSQFAKQGIVWNYDKGETITYDGLIDLTDNTINDARNLADSIFEGYGLWASTMAENQTEWGTSVYETQLTFRFEDYLNSENYFDIVIADNAASFGYIAAMANNHAYRTDANKSKGQTQGAIRWGGTGTNTKGLVPADGLNVSSTQAFAGWGLYYQIGLAGYNANCINLSYNVEENAAFCRAFWGGEDRLCYIRDFGTVYDNYAWAGFTDPSKVKLKITCNNGHGALLIKSVDGKSLAYDTEPMAIEHKGIYTFVNDEGESAVTSISKYVNGSANANGVNLSSFKGKGVVVDYKAGESYFYNKTIDLSDNNVNGLLFEGYGLSVNEAATNFSIVFSEKNNPSNYFEVKMEDLQLGGGYWLEAKNSVSYISALATNVDQGGYISVLKANFIADRCLPAMYAYTKNTDGSYTENFSNYDKRGWSMAPFVGLNGNSLDTIRLFYDKEMNAIFYEARWYGNAWNTLICLRDFDSDYEGNKTWSGFNNATEIEVTIKGNSGSGSLLVMNVDGESLAFNKDTVVADNSKYVYNYQTNGVSVANVEYDIPVVTLENVADGVVKNINEIYPSLYVEVLNNRNVIYNKVYVSGSKFTPVVPGTYTVNYYSNNTKQDLLYTVKGDVMGGAVQETSLNAMFSSKSGSVSVVDGGILLTGSEGETFTYKNNLYLGNASLDNLDFLLKMKFLVSDVIPSATSDEIISLYVTLTDVNNENNSITIWIHSNGGANTIIKVKTSSESDYAGLMSKPGAKSVGINYGSWALFNYSMSGTKPNESLGILYDSKINGLFADPKSFDTREIRKFQPVNGVDHKTYFDNKIKSWLGFTTNEVKMSIKFGELDAGVSSAKLLIEEINGQSFVKVGGQIYDSQSSIVAKLGETQTVIGSSYSIPSAKVLNVINGASAFNGNVVIKKGETEVSTIPYAENLSYVFQKSGEYRIIYDDGFNTEYEYSVYVCPRLNVIFDSNATVKVNNQVVASGDSIDLTGSTKFELALADGYGLYQVKVGERDITDYVKNGKFKLAKTDAVDISELNIIAKKIYSATYHGKTKTEVVSVFEGDVIDDSVIVKENGYEVVGYYKDAEFSTLFDFTSAITGDVDVYIKYKTIDYQINYLNGAGEFSGVVIPSEKSTTFNVESENLILPVLNASGYEFKGWYYNGVKVVSASDLPCQDVTLYPLFDKVKQNLITVNFNVNGGEGLSGTIIESGSTLPSVVPTKEGYTFTGWYLDEALTQKLEQGATLNSNVTLYAGYAEIVDDTIIESEIETVINTAEEVATPIRLSEIVKIIAIAVAGVGCLVIILKIVLTIIKRKKA